MKVMVQLYTRVGSELLVSSATSNGQSEPAVTALSSGGFVVSWTDPGDEGGDAGIKAQIFDVDGTKVGDEFLITIVAGGAEPTITALSSGGFVVSWMGTDADFSGIKAQVFDSDGAKVGAEFLVNTVTVSGQFTPTITALPSGGFVVSWAAYSGDGSGSGIKAQMFDASGTTIGDEFLVNTVTSGDQDQPTITGLSSGGFVVSWRDYSGQGDDASGYGIKAQIFDTSGAKVGAEFTVNSVTWQNQSEPTITALSSGGFVVSWRDESGQGDDVSGYGVKAQIFDADGSKVGGEFLVNSVTSSFQSEPTITALSSGGFVVSWRDDSGQGVDVSGSGIKAQVFDSDGTKVGGEFLVNTVTLDRQHEPTIAALPSGGFVVSWIDGEASASSIKAQLFAPSAGLTDTSLSTNTVSETAIENLAVATLSSTGGVNSSPTYTLISDSTGGAFVIEGNKLIVVDNDKLDFEGNPEVALTIRTTDENGSSSEEEFTLQVSDVAVETRYSAGGEFLVNTTTSGSQNAPTITPLASGGFVVGWVDSSGEGGDASSTSIKAQILDPHGEKVGSEFLVNTDTLDSQIEPTITALPSGGFVVSWLDVKGQGVGIGSYDVKAQIFDASGTKVGDEFLVNAETWRYRGVPTVTALSSGDFVVSWTDAGGLGGDPNGSGIKAQIFDAIGTKVGSEFLVNADTSGGQDGQAIVALPSGGFVVSWMDENGDADGYGIKAQLFDAHGTKVGAEFLVNTVTSGNQWDPKVTALSSGGFVVSWWGFVIEDGNAVSTGVKAQIFDADGTKVGGEFLVNTVSSGTEGGPAITALSSGGFVASWGGEDASGSGVKAQIFDAVGTKVGEEFLVNNETSSLQGWHAISSLSSDGFVVSWVDYSGEGGDASGTSIKAQIFHLADDLIGTFDADALTGDGANNGIYGFAGNDTLTGAEGIDRLDGGTGADAMSGGADNDTYVVDNVGDTVTENADQGTDTVETSLGTGSTLAQRQAAQYHLGANVENLVGTGDGQGLRGNDLNNHITAGSGDDYVNASDGGTDHVDSGNGRDVIYYGAQLDNSDANNAGDEGGDTRGDLLVIQGDYSAGLTLGDGALIDVEKFRILKGTNSSFGDTGGNSYSYNITTVDANVAAGARVVVQGGSLQLGEHLKFDGSAEIDGSFQMFGGHDSDELIGGAQGDHLLGRSGNDILTGNGGDDRFRGGLGADTMDGGSGSDTFVYAPLGGAEPYSNAALESTGTGHDTIIGFDFASDKIDLPQTVSALASLDGGTMSNASFDADLAAAVDAALAVNGAVLFTADSGDLTGKSFLVVDADGDGSYQADHDYVIQLVGATGTVPTMPDFFI